MNAMPEPDRYSSAQIALHWATLLLVVAAFSSMEFDEAFGRGEPRRLLQSLHYGFGLSLLLLTALRLGMRVLGHWPGPLPGTPRWQRWIAGGVHAALYAWLLAMPLSGWALAGADDKVVTLFGLPWPNLAVFGPAWEHDLEDLHESLASLGYALIGLHAAAALLHQLVLRDSTLRRMLPGAAG